LDKVIIINGLKRNLKISAPDSRLAVVQAYEHVTRSFYKFLPFMVPCLNSVHLFPDSVLQAYTFLFSFQLLLKKIKYLRKKFEKCAHRLRHSYPSVRSHATNREALNGLSLNFIFENFKQCSLHIPDLIKTTQI